MSFKRITNFDKGALAKFEGADFSLFKANIYEDEIINVYCCVCNAESYLVSVWEEVSDYINHDFLIQFSSDFNRWNSYLLFLSYDGVKKELQYLIENDKFAIRKLVFNGFLHKNDNVSNEDVIISWLERKLLLSDILINDFFVNEFDFNENLTEISKEILSCTKEDLLSKAFRESLIDKVLTRV